MQWFRSVKGLWGLQYHKANWGRRERLGCGTNWRGRFPPGVDRGEDGNPAAIDREGGCLL